MLLEIINTAYYGSYCTISSLKGTSHILINHYVRYKDTHHLIRSTQCTWKEKDSIKY